MYHHPGTTGSSSSTTDPRLAASAAAGGASSTTSQPPVDPPPYSTTSSSSTDPRSSSSYPAHLVSMPPPLAFSGAPAAPGHGSGGPPPSSLTQLSSSTPSGAGTTPSGAASWYSGGGGGSSDIRLPSLTAQVAPLDNAATAPSMAQQSQVITIYEFTPQSGVEGTAISINCNLTFPLDHGRGDSGGNKIRLYFGNQIVDTTLRPPTNNSEAYLIIANVPPLHNCGLTGSNAWSVPVTLHAVNDRGILEIQSLGEFGYISEASTFKKARKLSSKAGSPERRLSSAGYRRRRREDEGGYNPPTIPAGTAGAFVYDSPPPPQSQSLGLVRTTQITQVNSPNPGQPNPFIMRSKAQLQIEGDLMTMKSNWSPEMWASRRCLVAFTRRQVGATVYASFKAVEERDWTPNMIVISCLYHEARQECFFTSVDVIYLLECLMATRYTTEEKNRIRRNLESFKPTTLQKNEGQWQEFYAHIMNYPNPKPRNIDKGLKVFPWIHLEPALKKIFSNYSAYTNMPFTFDNPGPGHGSGPMGYPQHAHVSPDAMGFSDERASAPYGAPHGSDAMSPYVSHLPSYHRPALSGGSASGVPAGSSSSGEASAPPTAYGGEPPMPGYVNMPPPPGPYGRDYVSYAPPSSLSMTPHPGGYYDQPPPHMQYPHVGRGSSSSDFRVVGYHNEAGNPSRPHSNPSPHMPHNAYPPQQQQQPPPPPPPQS